MFINQLLCIILQSIYLLADGILITIVQWVLNQSKNIDNYLNQSLMLLVALNHILVMKKLLLKSHKEGLTLKESAIQTGYVTEEQFEAWIKPEDMVILIN